MLEKWEVPRIKLANSEVSIASASLGLSIIGSLVHLKGNHCSLENHPVNAHFFSHWVSLRDVWDEWSIKATADKITKATFTWESY